MTSEAAKKVLIIDDSKLNRLQAKLTLEKGGFTVLELDNAESYFENLWNYTDIGLVLLDLRLTGMSGVDVLRRMQVDQCSPWPPVIIVSANQDAPIIAEIISLGAKDYLTKPFEEEALLLRVKKHFNSNPEIMGNVCPPAKQLWCTFFTADARAMGSGVVIIEGTRVIGGTARFYFTGYCNLNTNPVSARIQVVKFAPGPSIFGAGVDYDNYTLVMSGTQEKDEFALSGYLEEKPKLKVAIRMKKLLDL